MKKSASKRLKSVHSTCPQLTARLSRGQLCTLLGLIAVGLEQCAADFTGEDLRTLVHLHQHFSRLMGWTDYDYACVDGTIVEARNPQKVVARYRRIRRSRLHLALSNG